MRVIAVTLAIVAAALAAGSNELPQLFGPVWGDHDTGQVKMTVTAHGGVGYTAPDSTSAGSGFRFPKNLAVSRLYYCGMLCGNDSSYVVDRFYGNPTPNLNKDWAIVDSLHRDNWYGGQEYTALMDDSRHPTPKGLTARLHSIALPVPYGHGVILTYDYWNAGSTPITGLYAGLWADFDISSSGTTDKGNTNRDRRLAYMCQTANPFPTCGLAVLAPHQAANLSTVYHVVWVYPTDSCVTEYQKVRWLDGTLHFDSSDLSADYSIVVSTGPFDLAPGDTHQTAFAVMGCSSEVHLFRKLDSLQEWFDANVGVAERNSAVPPLALLTVSPNPVTGPLRVRFGAPDRVEAALNLYDRNGRLVNRIWHGRLSGRAMDVTWAPRELGSGVYFLRLEGDKLDNTVKTVIAR
jgi:hypothetical protein